MTSRAEVVVESRSWLGVPWHHQGRTRAGCDCGGLIGAVAVALGIVPASWWQDTFDPLYGGYGRAPANGTLRRVCGSFMAKIDPAGMQPGDVMLMKFKSEPQHLAIVANYVHGGLSMIHAMSTVGKVAEHRLAPEWRARVVAAYSMPGVN
jgi:cell wall-associated NlpC family hydrolase